ncbi:MAG TPA: sigma factor-like helix-turn-helix DNA-binding protein [Solirubrobacteraceae bacterium]|jgi:transcriptional regulator with XRE-family HTH domain|nr:sigma factor-like helix-turn-helix DNA-binding protein [Solirubrobacteraceae bacterium]
MSVSDEWAETVKVDSALDLGRALAARRRRLKLTQERVAGVTGTERLLIHRLEHGQGDTIEFRIVQLVVNALGLDIELRPRGSKFIPRPPTNVTELGLSADALTSLDRAGIQEIARLGFADELIQRPEFRTGSELYEIASALRRHGLSLCLRVPGDRELEMLRLRIVEGMTLNEIGLRYGIIAERVRQILGQCYGLHGKPPATKQKPRRRPASIGRQAGV